MEKEAIKLIETFLSAVQKVDMEKLVTLMEPDMRWSQPGHNQVSGNKQSAGEVFQMVGKMFELSANTLTLAEVKVLAANSNQVACLLRWTAAHPSGKKLDIENIDVYTVANGKITEATVFTTDVEQENDFWA